MLHTTHALTESLRASLTAPKQAGRHILVVCIGTDRSTGDSFGPFTGSLLQSTSRYPYIYGTLMQVSAVPSGSAISVSVKAVSVLPLLSEATCLLSATSPLRASSVPAEHTTITRSSRRASALWHIWHHNSQARSQRFCPY